MRFLGYAFALTVSVAVGAWAAPVSATELDPVCRVRKVGSSQPRDGQTDVPIDVQPRLFMIDDEDCLADFSELSGVLEAPGEPPIPNVTLWFGPPGMAYKEVQLKHDLVPGRTYVLKLEGSDPDPVSDPITMPVELIRFTTGSRRATPLAGPPSVEILSLRYDDDDDGPADTKMHTLRYRVTPAAADDDGLSLVEVTSAFGLHGSLPLVNLAPVEGASSFWAVPGAEVCVTGLQIDAANNKQSSAPVCATSVVDPATTGCAVSVASTGPRGDAVIGVATLLGALAMLRRRPLSSRQ